MNPDELSDNPESGQDSTAKKVPKAPDKKKFEARHEEICKAIREKEAHLRGVNQKPDESVQEMLRSLRTEKDGKIAKRKKIDSDMRTLNQDISKKNAELTKVQSSLQGYKSESRIDEAIQRLEDQLKRNNFKISEERKIVAEIDILRRSKKALIGFTTVKCEIDAMRDQLRIKREERDQCYKMVTAIKQKEEEARRGLQEEKLRNDALKRELDELKEQRRILQQEQRIQEKEYASWRFQHRRSLNQQQRRRREEERQEREREFQRAMVEYEASLEPYEEQKQLCLTLITYLQSLIPVEQHHSDVAMETAASVATVEEPVDLAQSFEKEGLVLLKKKTEDLFTGKPRSQKRSKKDKRRNKPLVHTPQTLSQFQQMEIKPPSTVNEVQEAIQQLNSKKAYYDTLPVHRAEYSLQTLQMDPPSGGGSSNDTGGAPSVAESAFTESIPSTPEVQLDNLAPNFLATRGDDGASLRRLSGDSGACELEDRADSECNDPGNDEGFQPVSTHSSVDSSSASSATTVMDVEDIHMSGLTIEDCGHKTVENVNE